MSTVLNERRLSFVFYFSVADFVVLPVTGMIPEWPSDRVSRRYIWYVLEINYPQIKKERAS